MRSHLTRVVFRRLLDGRPIAHSRCLNRQYHTTRNGRTITARTAISAPSRRTFFGSFFKPPAQDTRKKVDVFPGLEVMQDLSRAEMLDSRRPSEEQVRTAVKAFIDTKMKRREGLDEMVAGHFLGALRWLQRKSAVAPPESAEGVSKATEKQEPSQWSDAEFVRKAIRTVARTDPRVITETHQGLAVTLRDAMLPTRLNLATTEIEDAVISDGASIVQMLTVVGKIPEAQDYLRSMLDMQALPENVVQQSCLHLISGLDLQGATEAEVITVTELLTSRGFVLNQDIRRALIGYFAHRDQLKKAIEQLDMPFQNPLKDARQAGSTPSVPELVAILEACIRLKDERVGRGLLEKYLEHFRENVAVWVCVFKFAAAVGRGVDEVERMIGVMEKHQPAHSKLRLNISIVNELVKFAIDRNDPYLAERFTALGQKRGIEPDALTYIYQMAYRLSIDDVDGALAAYDRSRTLPTTENSSNSKEHAQEINAVNDLIQALCRVERRYPFERIIAIADELNGRPDTHFHAATTASLTVLHLRREEYHDVVDLLKKHTVGYSVIERQLVRDTMVDYCFDMRNSIAKVWDCYQIFRQIFDNETPREVRTTIMNEFYKRRRADMGYHVFTHMRDSPNPVIRATKDTYVDALVGIGRCKDEETLEFVHNQLKLDPHIELDTRLSNALMLAYIGINEPRKALEFWEDIIGSREGPSYNSILIALRACEVKPYGVEEGSVIWDRLMSQDIEVTKEVFTAWCACLVGNGYQKLAGEMLGRAGEFGIELDTWILGSIFNAAGSDAYNQAHFKAQLVKEYPELAKELDAMPKRRQRNRSTRINSIDRALVA